MSTQSNVLGEISRIQAPTQVHRSKFKLELLILYGIATLLSLIFMFPFFWTLMSSLKTPQEMRNFPPSWVPTVPQWHNYTTVLDTVPFLLWAYNSLFVAILTTSGIVLSASIVAYSFARFNYRGRDILFIITLGTIMLPAQVTLIPQFVLFHKLGWVNTLYPLWVPAWFGGGAFAIFLMRQFIMSLPKELDEAARIDGASYFRVFWQILLPLCKPVIATVSVISFIASWDDFVNPLIYLQLPEKLTLAVGLNYFKTIPEVAGEPTQHLLMAGSIMMILPVIVLFFATQRYFIRGIVMSGLKG